MNKKELKELRRVDPSVMGTVGERVDIFHKGARMASYAFFNFEENFFSEVVISVSGFKIHVHNKANTEMKVDFSTFNKDVFYQRRKSGSYDFYNMGYNFTNIVNRLETILVSELADFSFQKTPVTFYEVAAEAFGLMSKGEVDTLVEDIKIVNRALLAVGRSDYSYYGTNLFPMGGTIYMSKYNGKTCQTEQEIAYESNFQDFVNSYHRVMSLLRKEMSIEDMRKNLISATVMPKGTILLTSEKGITFEERDGGVKSEDLLLCNQTR